MGEVRALPRPGQEVELRRRGGPPRTYGRVLRRFRDTETGYTTFLVRVPDEGVWECNVWDLMDPTREPPVKVL